MALFPLDPEAPGALVRGDVYVPGKACPMSCFSSPDIGVVLARAAKIGATALHEEKKSIGENGFVAGIEDPERNRVALRPQAR